MRIRLRFAPLPALLMLTLAACSGSASPAGPSGWTKVDQNTWTKGSGAREQRYVVNTTPFLGSLKQLASQTTMNIVLKHRGVHFVSSVPLDGCPADAGLATYRFPKTILQEAFAVANGNATTITYQRPLDEPADPAVLTAISHRLCGAVG